MQSKKRPLTVKAEDKSRAYGESNPILTLSYDGFINGETKDVLIGELNLVYADDITDATPVGTYVEKTSASGFTANNYDITYKKGNVTITKIMVAASAGIAKRNYLTVEFNKAVKGLSADNFTVKNGAVETTLTSVTENNDGKTYFLSGDFALGVEYMVEIKLENSNYEITGSPITLVPTRSSGGGGGGGSSSLYTVSFNTNGGSKVESVKVKKGDTVKAPVTPTKDGLVFDGWYTDKNLTTKYDFFAKITKSITLYAKWTEKPTDNSENEIVFVIGEKNAKVFGIDKLTPLRNCKGVHCKKKWLK